MKYKILEADPIHSTHKFFVDNISDLEELPKEPGSTTLVANTGDTYICNNNGEWVMYIDNPIENNSSSQENLIEFAVAIDMWGGSGIEYSDSIHGVFKDEDDNIIEMTKSLMNDDSKTYFTGKAKPGNIICYIPESPYKLSTYDPYLQVVIYPSKEDFLEENSSSRIYAYQSRIQEIEAKEGRWYFILPANNYTVIVPCLM